MVRPAAPRRDHPRSRGVYTRRGSVCTTAPGSSPLARGLHRGKRYSRIGTGIIPARAGFTPAEQRRRPVGGDHPRSRGVYVVRHAGGLSCAGSSPLARGLRPNRGSLSPRSRIIPARAGFTAGAPQCARPSWDHPRSRGVYPAGGIEPPVRPGSSPLARGLRPHRARWRDRPRIIPARAGFTGG